jgi:hypothetical protein
MRALKRGEVILLANSCLYDNTHLEKSPHAAIRVVCVPRAGTF